jgi:hypothetical protein
VRTDARQIELPLHRGSWGGRRPGAGRPRGPSPRVPHTRRERFARGRPCHVTLKVRPDVASLRSPRLARAVEAAFRRGCERGSFRLVHYSLQSDHAYLVVEAVSREELGKGMKSLGARFSRSVNRALSRSGRVLADRYHLRVLRTPREVRHALAYVLLNARRHLAKRLARGVRMPAPRIDPASSGAWFDGWRRGGRGGVVSPAFGLPELPRRAAPGLARELAPAVSPARSWLLRVGWRRHGLIDPAEVPGGGRRR